MLALEHISLTLGDRHLLDNVSVLINPGERIGLVGPNGAGKSTLLKIISGRIEPNAGNISMSKSATVGYLPQSRALIKSRNMFYTNMLRLFFFSFEEHW